MVYLTIARKNATRGKPIVQRYKNTSILKVPRIAKLINAEGANFYWATLSNENGNILAYYHHHTGTQPLTHQQYKAEVEQDKDDTGTVLCGLVPSNEGRNKGISELKYLRIAEIDAPNVLNEHLPNYFKMILFKENVPYAEKWFFNNKLCTKKLLTQKFT